jgi:hypothetical protein
MEEIMEKPKKAIKEKVRFAFTSHDIVIEAETIEEAQKILFSKI